MHNSAEFDQPAVFPVIRFAGLKFMPLDVDETVRALVDRPADAPFAAFVTPNAEHAFLRTRDAEFRALGDGCWLSTNDSRVMGRAARLAGLELKFAPGAYVVDRLVRENLGINDPITIIGCTQPIVSRLIAAFGLTNVGHHIPPMGFINDPDAVAAAIDFVVAHPARYVFVAMGPPQSEKFCARVIADGRATGIGLCIGSSLSVLVGDSNPAPDWMEQSGLVWLYRLVSEPQRLWRRYLLRGLYGLSLGLRDVVRYRLGLAKPASADG
jgi:N-acetylglucosaminyldiphosphoundecaprenol N-acetyl-beta-D-mannosaminyltransferase